MISAHMYTISVMRCMMGIIQSDIYRYTYITYPGIV